MATPSFTGNYSVTRQYLSGDYTVYGGKLYQAQNGGNIGIPPSTVTNEWWTLIASQFLNDGEFTLDTNYVAGECVTYNGVTYVSLINNNNYGETPDNNSNHWGVLAQKTLNILTSGDNNLSIGLKRQVLSPTNTGTPVWKDLVDVLPAGNPNQFLQLGDTGGIQWAAVVPSGGTTGQVIKKDYLGLSEWMDVISSDMNITPNTLSTNTVTTNSLVSNTYNYPNGEYPGYTYSLDDISSQFDGIKESFVLSYNSGTTVVPNNPNQLQISIGNVPIFPANKLNDYQNLTEIAVFNSGYYLTGNTINFATAPSTGMSFYGTYKTNQDSMPSFTFKQLPMSALNIMLGS